MTNQDQAQPDAGDLPAEGAQPSAPYRPGLLIGLGIDMAPVTPPGCRPIQIHYCYDPEHKASETNPIPYTYYGTVDYKDLPVHLDHIIRHIQKETT